VKRLVFRVIPDETTRLAALKRGEVDIVYSIRGELAEELKRSPGLSLKAVVLQGTYWLYFADQWTQNHRGMISACGRRPAWPSTARPSTRHSPSAFPDHRQHHPDELRVLLAAARARLRSSRRQEAPGRRRVSQRLRGRRVLLRRHLRQPSARR